MQGKRFAAIAGALAVCVTSGALCAWLRTPLPWMIGPLAGMALFQFGGASLEAPPFGREAGQLTIGIALGLYFTPAVAREVLANGPTLFAAAAGVFLIGVAASLFLERAAGVDHPTAFFSSAIGGAAEMVILADRHDALVDRVALAHSLRLLVVVTAVPVAITLLGQTGSDDYRPVLVPFDPAKLALLAGLALASAFAWRRTGLPNPFMMGPLLLVIALTAGGVVFSSIPSWMTNVAQLLLACNLGSRFQQSFLREAPRFMAAVLASVALMLVLAALLALGLAWLAGLMPATILLACAPGGIAEMSITAKVLRVGVAFVTAAHVTRFVIVMLFTEPAYRLLARRRAKG
ncbi:MAG TPA: AbrB family transcriptional regulator [Usitatibacteraceae bacterium]|nr:AbrB family transcriptional regulator [Usitatibacteraceae bacterium]